MKGIDSQWVLAQCFPAQHREAMIVVMRNAKAGAPCLAKNCSGCDTVEGVGLCSECYWNSCGLLWSKLKHHVEPV